MGQFTLRVLEGLLGAGILAMIALLTMQAAERRLGTKSTSSLLPVLIWSPVAIIFFRVFNLLSFDRLIQIDIVALLVGVATLMILDFFLVVRYRIFKGAAIDKSLLKKRKMFYILYCSYWFGIIFIAYSRTPSQWTTDKLSLRSLATSSSISLLVIGFLSTINIALHIFAVLMRQTHKIEDDNEVMAAIETTRERRAGIPVGPDRGQRLTIGMSWLFFLFSCIVLFVCAALLLYSSWLLSGRLLIGLTLLIKKFMTIPFIRVMQASGLIQE